MRRWAQEIEALSRSVDQRSRDRDEPLDALWRDIELRRRQIRAHSSALSSCASAALRVLKAPEGPERQDALERLNAPQPGLNGLTLLGFFVSSNLAHIAQGLMAIGADPQAKDAKGQSALGLAASKAEALNGGAGLAARQAEDAAALHALLSARALSDELSHGSASAGPRRPPRL